MKPMKMKHILIYASLLSVVLIGASCEKEEFELEESFWELNPNQDLARFDSILYDPWAELMRIYVTWDTALLATTPGVYPYLQHNSTSWLKRSVIGGYWYIQRPIRFFTYEFSVKFRGHDGSTRSYADTSFATW